MLEADLTERQKERDLAYWRDEIEVATRLLEKAQDRKLYAHRRYAEISMQSVGPDGYEDEKAWE